MSAVGRVGMDAKLLVNKAGNTGLKAIFEAVFAGGNAIINGAAGEVAFCKNQSVHFGVNCKVIFHRAL